MFEIVDFKNLYIQSVVSPYLKNQKNSEILCTLFQKYDMINSTFYQF